MVITSIRVLLNFMEFLSKAIFFNTGISQGSAATCLRCGASLLVSLLVKE